MHTRLRTWSFLVLLSSIASSALAQTPSAGAIAPDAAAPAPPPYSLPWQLRPAAIGTVVRSDTAYAMYEDAATGESGSTIATTLLASYKLTPEIAPMVRLGFVQNTPPAGDGGASFVNPVVGGTYLLKLSPELRLALFLGLALPVGMGGGNSPDAAVAAANKSGIPARSAMDNAMFAVNDFTVFPGVDVAYVAGGFTAQLEATVLQLTRTRGGNIQADSSKTNLTSGLHLGYFVIPQLSVGADLRYQRWLSTPKSVEADTTDTLRDNATVAVGIRGHLQLGPTMWLRPGLAFATALDDPMSNGSYNIIQIDLPLAL